VFQLSWLGFVRPPRTRQRAYNAHKPQLKPKEIYIMPDPTGQFTCPEVSDWFARETGRFNIDIHDKRIMSDPWYRLTRRGVFPLGMGTTLTEITVARILTSSVENDWVDVATSNANLANGCVPAPNDLQFGNIRRTWNLQTKSYRTPCLCLDDLKTSFQITSQVEKTVSELTRLTSWIDSNRQRSEFSRLTWKISMRPGLPNSANLDASLLPPSSGMSQDFLDVERLRLLRDGAWENASGMGPGGPVLNLIIDPEESQNIIRNNPDARQDIRFAMPSELVQPLGVERDYKGWYHVPDVYIPRLNYVQGLNNPWVYVLPFKQVTTTEGYDWVPNEAYYTAQYGICYAHHMDVYECAIQQVGPDIPDAPFTDYAYYYTMQFFWLNIISDLNPLGKIGRWLGISQSGSRPIHPEYGRTFIYRRCPLDLQFSSCIYS
jgi:hypothetical protein